MIRHSGNFLKLSKNTLSSSQQFWFSLLNPQPQEDHDLIFIRHAESSFNKACQDYRVRNQIPYVWEQLCNHEDFDHTVLFNPKYIDCPLTDRGINQSKNAKYLLEDQPIDCVLVSPHLRALQTCQKIFQNRNIPVIVQPTLVSPLRSCSDVNRTTSFKRKRFPHFNFQVLNKHDELWFLNYLNYQQRSYCLEYFHKNKITDPEHKRFQLVKMLKQGKIYEEPQTYRKRISQVKKKLKSYKQHYNFIAIVTHYYTIQYLSAKNFEKDGTPEYYMDIKNCHPYYSSFEQISRNQTI